MDGSLREGINARIIARRIVSELTARGYDARLITPEEDDIPLSTRVKRVNDICQRVGSRKACVVSIHHDAMGYGKYWMPAQGWSVRCSKGRHAKNVSLGSQRLAECLFDEACKMGRQMRQPLLAQKYWVQDLAICRDTLCPACLTENFFMTNLDDLEFIKSEAGISAIVEAHVNALIKYSQL